MKKTLCSVLALSLILLSSSLSVAGQPVTCLEEAPTDLSCTVTAETVDFAWSGVAGAAKYSVDVEIVDPAGAFFEQSFSSHEMTLSVPLDELAACGTASSKVKGLVHPKTMKCRQSNPWSEIPCEFTIPCPDLP